MSDFEEELKLDFLNESEEILSNAEDAFLRLEDQRDNPELIDEIFRLAHNLKGTSKAVGFSVLSDLTHVAENLILKIKESEIEVDDDVVSVLLEFKDRVEKIVSNLKDDLNYTEDISDFVSLVEGVSSENSSEAKEEENIASWEDMDSLEKALQEADPVESSTDKSQVEINDTALESQSELGLNLDDNSKKNTNKENNEKDEKDENIIFDAALESLEELGITLEAEEKDKEPKKPVKTDISLVQANKDEKPVKSEPTKKAEKNKEAKKTPAESDESIRVKLERIDKMNNIIGELVILQTVISQRRYEFIHDDISNKSIGMMNKLFKEAQELAMSFRMLPVKSTFQKMNRIVRDTSRELGKKVKLNIIGEETEVDKTVIEKIGDPLVHIIRNAVDHGLESTEERVKAGKDETGHVELMAFHEGSNLILQITDDGKGINPEIIKKKAIEKGLIGANEALSDQAVIQLIFHAGFSTKEKVTDVSGRGVGMDVVKTNIEELGGEVKVMSKIGGGSSFRITLPLALAIIEGIVIRVEAESFVLPLSQIYELTKATQNEVEKFSGGLELFRLRGEVLPLFNLNQKIGRKKQTDTQLTVIVVRGLSYAFGVVVDDVINQQQIVIKKIGDDIRNQKGIMRSAIMSNGQPAIILDLFELFKDDMKKSKSYAKLREQNLSA